LLLESISYPADLTIGERKTRELLGAQIVLVIGTEPDCIVPSGWIMRKVTMFHRARHSG